MNNTFGIWMVVAGAAAVVLLLLLGSLAVVDDGATDTALAPDEAVIAAADDRSAGSTYWQPVEVQSTVPQPVAQQVVAGGAFPVSAPASPAATVSMTSAVRSPCGRPGCTSHVAQPVASAATVRTSSGCGQPSIPCGQPACTSCPSTVAVAPVVAPVVTTPSAHLVGGCGRPSTPCPTVPCTPPSWGCYDVCTDPCRVLKPGINRNMPLCVDECTLLQLRSTVSHPICGQICFEWSASKGWFLDPTASDPLYLAPTTAFCEGEDVWITLTVTDAMGAQYSDAVSVHVRDVP